MCDLRFADEFYLMDGSSGERQDFCNRLVDRATAYGMEVSTDKSKIKTNSTNNISADIRINGQKLEEVTSFKNPGAILSKDGSCSAEVDIRNASEMAAMARLNTVSYTHLTLPTTSRV